MIKSMTGYGSASCTLCAKTFTVEIKSVNSRYSDFSVKLPRIYTFLEEPVRKKASERINRGKVDIYINVESDGDEDCVVKLNLPLAKAYLDSLKSLSSSLSLSSNASAETFLRIPDVFSVEKAQEDKDSIESTVLKALDEALDNFDAMRIAEGEKLKSDLLSHLDFIEKSIDEIEKRAPEIVNDYRARLEERIRTVLEERTFDESRLLTEVAIFSEKVDTNEETVRLKSHVAQFKKMLEDGGCVGRKIDFLIQEMNREINTVGSKSNDLATAKTVIDLKAETEKLREQIQNIE